MTVAWLEDRDLTAEEAEGCITEIRNSVAVFGEWIAKMLNGRAWLALGYESWDAMCDERLAGIRLAIPMRREAANFLRSQGFSTRAIGSGLRVDRKTIRDDLAAGGEKPPTSTPEPDRPGAPVTGLDGKTYNPPSRPPAPSSTPKPEAVLTPEQQERLDRQAEREEVQRRQRVETTLLCEHVVVIAQSLDLDLGHYYTAEYVIPGRAVTCQVIADAIAALGQLALVWKERDLP